MIVTRHAAGRKAVLQHLANRSFVARAAVEPPATSIKPESSDVPDSFNSLDVKRLAASSEASISAVPLAEPASWVSTITDSGVVRWYLRNLEARPLPTKCWTSLSGFLIGDVTAQLLTEPTYVLSRTLILAGYGFFIDAPAGHAFYNWLDANVEPGSPKTAKAVGQKILIDQLIYAPIFTCILYTYLQLANGDAAAIPDVLQAKVVPTLMANYAVWPLAHALNFYYVPTEQRILYNNFVAICWTTWLSYLAH